MEKQHLTTMLNDQRSFNVVVVLTKIVTSYSYVVQIVSQKFYFLIRPNVSVYKVC